MLHSFSSSKSQTSTTQSFTKDGQTTTFHSHSSNQEQSSTTLSVRVIGAHDLVNVQTMGKQDPFVQFSLNYEDKTTFVKTFTHENAGKTAQWNQSFSLPLNGEPDLFVEVLDEESTVDEVIGFAAIPINQVVHASGANFNGLFNLFTVKGEHAGVINLHLAAVGFPNSQNANLHTEPVEGQSYLNEGHATRMKSSKKKAQGVQIGGALFGGALAIGAGFLGKKLYDDHREKQSQVSEEEAERLRQQEEEAQQEESRTEEHSAEKRDEESTEKYAHKQSSDNEESHGNKYGKKKECEKKEKKDCDKKEKKNCDKKEKKDKKKKCRRNSNSSGSGSGSSDSGSDSDDDKKSSKKWNPVGTYSAGDRVKYNGKTYMCLQGHTSNPTWQPGAAHSLWQAE